MAQVMSSWEVPGLGLGSEAGQMVSFGFQPCKEPCSCALTDEPPLGMAHSGAYLSKPRASALSQTQQDVSLTEENHPGLCCANQQMRAWPDSPLGGTAGKQLSMQVPGRPCCPGGPFCKSQSLSSA